MLQGEGVVKKDCGVVGMWFSDGVVERKCEGARVWERESECLAYGGYFWLRVWLVGDQGYG